MFTGLIEGLCRIKSVSRSGGTGGMELSIDLSELADDVKIGDSIAINGVCLTVRSLERSNASFDVSGETLARATIGKLTSGSMVNAERAMKASERFGGHFVQGHVDGTARIASIRQKQQFATIEFAAGEELAGQMIIKGSVAVDGISLTISKLSAASFAVEVIPQTLKDTTLGKAREGDEVNIEIDLLTKIVKNQVEKMLPAKQGLTIDKLKELGF